ncbi:MAG: PD40 domain-containing protein, partial [Proteobacteria bacterium]|nr:PD40 domain-containing protein [Pseudomonadota bacterium]
MILLRFLAPAVVASMLTLTAIASTAEDGGPAAETLAFVRRGNIWAATAEGTGKRRLTGLGACGGPALSPDAKQVAFHSRGAADIYPGTGFGQIYLVDMAGGEPKRLRFEGILAAEHPSFSPDGKRLVFVGLSEVRKEGKGEDGHVHATMSVSIGDIHSGRTRTVLRRENVMLDVGYVYSNPVFSPDGQWILWQQSGSDVSGGFAVTDLKGRTDFRFPPRDTDSTPYWNPSLALDGQTVLCYSPATSDASDDMIHAVDRKTGKSVEVTVGANPVFVRNGTAIVFERWTNRWSDKASSDLWILDLKPGASPRRLITDASEPAGALFG